MNKNNLVILRGSNELKLGSDTLTPNEHYRRLSNGEDSHIVNGIRMNELFFNEYFEYSYTRVIRDWTDMNLIVNGNPIKKKEFKEYLDIHSYGNNKVGFLGHRERIYGFYLNYSNKLDTLNDAYEIFIEVINGQMVYFDRETIQFGNCGIPIGGGRLRKKLNYTI